MKRATLFVSIASAVVLCVGLVLWPTHYPSTPFSISLQRDVKQGLSAVISNSSAALLVRHSASPLDIVSIFPTRMVTNFAGGSGFTGADFYGPGKSKSVAIASGIVPGAEKIIIGVDYHALSWRSKIALKLPNVCPLETVAGVLFAIDRFYGEERTWSEEFSLIEGRNR